jgi:hypothetical protein
LRREWNELEKRKVQRGIEGLRVVVKIKTVEVEVFELIELLVSPQTSPSPFAEAFNPIASIIAIISLRNSVNSNCF